MSQLKHTLWTKAAGLSALLLLALPATALADDYIVSRTQTSGGFWRYDFHYTTTDIDGETPVELSAAIFMSTSLHDGETTAKGCALLNHFTITRDAESPTSVTGMFSLEGILTRAPYFFIESDGIGFGLTKERRQPYLIGRVNARNNIDAYLAGKRLLEKEGLSFGSTVVNLGYSQGGHSGMWVSRLVEEGYRADELASIDYNILGGGPYDIYSHYKYLLSTGTTSYPVALPLILYGYVAADSSVSASEVFPEALLEKIPEWLDTKDYATTTINDSIYKHFGSNAGGSIDISKITTPEFSDTTSALMQRLIPKMKDNSLVYSDWTPTRTAKMRFTHSTGDEVVPYLNMESLEAFLIRQGYDNYTIDHSSTSTHTATGTSYALTALAELQQFVPTGIDSFSAPTEQKAPQIYRLDGTSVISKGSMEETLRSLTPGLYIVGKKTVVVR